MSILDMKGFDSSIWFMVGAVVLLLTLFFCAKASDRWRKPFILISVIYNIVYLVWRMVFTLPFSYGIASIVLGILLLLAEFVGVWQSTIYRMLFMHPYKLEEKSASAWQNRLPTVDVFIATYNESIPILRRTAVACKNLDYPADLLNIYLCDDGKRAVARELCEELGIHYLSRADNQHAKAGNINHALGASNGEFVVLLDADMVPKSSFLEHTIGYFVDDNVAFVQTPQVFFNPDPYQFNLGLHHKIPNEQDFFMLDIQASRAGYNAVLHVGTNAVFRRKALESIGGIPTGTITEDMATGMLLQAKGYQSVFVREVLCTGLSVESFSDLILQRERWCRGNIQVTKKWSPITVKGLGLAQRIIYIDGLIYWFLGVQKIIYLLAPLLYLLLGTVILSASVNNLLLFWFPSYLASFLSYRVLTKKSRSITWSHIYDVATAPYLAISALMEAIFSRPIPFRVTPKGMGCEKTTFSLRTAMPHIVLMVLTILAWIMAWLKLSNGSGNAESIILNTAWSVYNGAAILLSILVCIEKPRKRSNERIMVEDPVSMGVNDNASCRIVDISETGAQIQCDQADSPVLPGEDVHLVSNAIGDLDGRVTRVKTRKGKASFGIEFKAPSKEMYRRLVKVISDKNKGYQGNKK